MPKEMYNGGIPYDAPNYSTCKCGHAPLGHKHGYTGRECGAVTCNCTKVHGIYLNIIGGSPVEYRLTCQNCHSADLYWSKKEEVSYKRCNKCQQFVVLT